MRFAGVSAYFPFTLKILICGLLFLSFHATLCQPQLNWALNCSLNHCQLVSQIQLEPCWRFSTPNQTHLHRVLFSREGCERNGLNVGKKRPLCELNTNAHFSSKSHFMKVIQNQNFDIKPSLQSCIL